MSFEHCQQIIERRYNTFLLWCYRKSIPGKVKRMREKETIDVLFILGELSSWKTEDLYLYMVNHPRFNPMLGIIKSPEDTSFYRELEDALKDKGYPFFKLKASNFGQPDIVIYQKPYDWSYPHNLIWRFHLNSLFCYSAYGLHSLTERWSISQPLHQIAWQLYYENDLAASCERALMQDKGRNIFVTGLPFMDRLMRPKNDFVDPWKRLNHNRKRIIYAPHHTIADMHLKGIGFSTFLDNADLILHLAQKYNDSTQWAFKPHPLLRNNLNQVWGKEKTDAYYNQWAIMENTQLANGDYLGLFKYSDAMIHDCASFTIEYLYINKPVLYLVRDEHHADVLNDFARKAYDLHYRASQPNHIEEFIQQVIDGLDPLKDDRTAFYNDYLIPPHGKSACENITDAILFSKLNF